MRRAWVDIDLGALLRNAERAIAQAGAPLVPMVKADGYGLGAVRVARTLERIKPWGFGVGTVAEGEELRNAAIRRPILVFTPLLSGDFDAALRADLIPALSDPVAILRWAETGRPWHLAIDSGMNRAGIGWDRVSELRDVLIASPPQGAFTHFHSAERNDESRTLQEERFAHALSQLPARPLLLHAENSPALEHQGPSRWNLVRPGIFLYGVGSGNAAQIEPEPVVSLRARIVDLRVVSSGETVSYEAAYRAASDIRVATMAIGYADGYRRALSNRAEAIVHGRRVPIVGNVTMDMTMIDVTDVECSVGDAATLIGTEGDETITVADFAAYGDLSPYEVLTGLRSRLSRRYVEEPAP